uniref:Uncharacterized protein n=1 Tax=Phaeomonas parva TaxID=124430 RepID=A0A7S1XV24_9STRA
MNECRKNQEEKSRGGRKKKKKKYVAGSGAGDGGGGGGGGIQLDDRYSLQEQVTITAENILHSAAGCSLKAVELANTIRSRLGTDTLSAIRKQFGGLLTLLESQPDIFIVRRIPKSDIVSLRYPNRSSKAPSQGPPGAPHQQGQVMIPRTPSPGITVLSNSGPGAGSNSGGKQQVYYLTRAPPQWLGQTATYVIASDGPQGPGGPPPPPQSGSAPQQSYEYYMPPGVEQESYGSHHHQPQVGSYVSSGSEYAGPGSANASNQEPHSLSTSPYSSGGHMPQSHGGQASAPQGMPPQHGHGGHPGGHPGSHGSHGSHGQGSGSSYYGGEQPNHGHQHGPPHQALHDQGLGGPPTQGSHELSDELVEALTVETMVPTQAWDSDATRDFPFVQAVIDTLTQLGSTATISKLRGHLKHRLHLNKSVKTVPLKAFMRAYPQYFKVNGNTASLQLHVRSSVPVCSVPIRIRSPGGAGMPVHYMHH